MVPELQRDGAYRAEIGGTTESETEAQEAIEALTARQDGVPNPCPPGCREAPDPK